MQMKYMIEKEYMYNRKFKESVDKYCKENNCGIEEAFNSKHIENLFWKYTDV